MEADAGCEPLVIVHVSTVVALIGAALARAVCHSPRAPVSALAGTGDGHTPPVLARLVVGVAVVNGESADGRRVKVPPARGGESVAQCRPVEDADCPAAARPPIHVAE